MSGQGKGGYGQSYGQPYGSGQSSYGYGYPGQQGSFFSTGGSARPNLGGGYQTLPYQIPDGGIPQGMGTLSGNGFQSSDPMTMPSSLPGGQFHSVDPMTAPQSMPGFPIPQTGNPIGRAPSQAPGNPAANAWYGTVGGNGSLSSQGVTQAQQGMGIGMTPQGTLSFAPSGSLNQISSATASLMGARNNGQGQWVNAQGQVIGLV